MWYILHKYTIKMYIYILLQRWRKLSIDRSVDNMVVQFWTIIAVPTSGHDSARCGVKYIRNKLRTSVLSGTVVTVVVASTPVYF